MKCECRVSKGRTKPSRIICGRGASFYNVSGVLTGMQLRLCWNHARQLEATFRLHVQKATALEQSAALKGNA